MTRLCLAGVALATITASLAAVAPATAGSGPCGAPTAQDEWPTFGRDLANTRTQEHAGDISPITAPTLQPVWSFSTGAAVNVFSDLNGTPIVSGGCVFLNTAAGDVVALDARDGAVVWRHHVALDPGTVAGLGGTFAPTWYETRAADLPSHASKPRSGAGHGSPAAKNDRRRHFVQEEVNALKTLNGIDVFLTHEAARPFPLARVRDAGKTPVNEVLSAMQPRLHLFGHHHIYTVAQRQGVPSIGLEKACDSYLVLDGKTLAHQRLTI